jgi:hypothetical protein
MQGGIGSVRVVRRSLRVRRGTNLGDTSCFAGFEEGDESVIWRGRVVESYTTVEGSSS